MTVDFIGVLEILTDNLVLIVLSLIVIYVISRECRRPRNLPPGPRPWPLIGKYSVLLLFAQVIFITKADTMIPTQKMIVRNSTAK